VHGMARRHATSACTCISSAHESRRVPVHASTPCAPDDKDRSTGGLSGSLRAGPQDQHCTCRGFVCRSTKPCALRHAAAPACRALSSATAAARCCRESSDRYVYGVTVSVTVSPWAGLCCRRRNNSIDDCCERTARTSAVPQRSLPCTAPPQSALEACTGRRCMAARYGCAPRSIGGHATGGWAGAARVLGHHQLWRHCRRCAAPIRLLRSPHIRWQLQPAGCPAAAVQPGVLGAGVALPGGGEHPAGGRR
jgi:hypothetical protein